MTNRNTKTGQYQRRGFRGVKLGVILGGILAVGGVGYAQQQGHIDLGNILSNSYEVTREVVTETVTVVEEVPVSEVDKRISDAQEAAHDQIEQDAEKMKQEYIADRMLEIEIKVRDEYIAEQEAINLEKKELTKSY